MNNTSLRRYHELHIRLTELKAGEEVMSQIDTASVERQRFAHYLIVQKRLNLHSALRRLRMIDPDYRTLPGDLRSYRAQVAAILFEVLGPERFRLADQLLRKYERHIRRSYCRGITSIEAVRLLLPRCPELQVA